MSNFDITAHLADLSDDDLKAKFKESTDDLVEAAGGADTEWHEACFAGTIIYATEMNKRGIVLRKLRVARGITRALPFVLLAALAVIVIINGGRYA